MTTDDTRTHNVVGDIADRVAATPAAVAVADAQEEWDYARLWRAASNTAAAIRTAGVGSKPVLLALRPSARWLAGILSIWRSGAIAVPIDVDHPPGRLTNLAGSCRAALTLTATGEPAPWAQHLPSLPVSDGSEIDVADLDFHAREAACVFFTSGSTGRPKPVVVGHSGLADRVRAMTQVYDVTPADRVAQLSSPTFDAMLWEVLPALVRGGQIRIPSGAARVPGPGLARWLAAERITAFTCTPTVLAAIPFTELPAVRLIVLGGEALHCGPLDQWLSRYRVANAYGPTESTIAVVVAERLLPGQSPVPIGRPLPGVSVRIVDRHTRPVSNGQTGELYLAGTGLALEYLGLPAETAAAFPVLDLGEGPCRYYRTGDLVRLLPDGQLTFVGRTDDQLNLGGVRLEPGEIEACALRLDGVHAAAAIAVSHSDGQPILSLHAAAEPGVTAQTLRRHLAAHLPVSAVPIRIRMATQLPRTSSGKIDRATLASTTTSPGVGAVAMSMALPDRVVEWWQDLTGTTPTLGADFFTGGGTSLAAVRLVSLVNEEYDTDLTITAFVAEPTVEHLTRVLVPTDTGSPGRAREGKPR